MQAAGYCGELTAAIGFYIAFAELLNETWFRGRVSTCHVSDMLTITRNSYCMLCQ